MWVLELFCVGGGVFIAQCFLCGMFGQSIFGLDVKVVLRLNASLNLILVNQNLVNLLPRPDASYFDRVAGLAWTVPHAHGFGEHLHRAGRSFADEDLTAARLSHGMEHQTDRLIQREKKTRHVRNGYSQWFAPLYLLLKERNY